LCQSIEIFLWLRSLDTVPHGRVLPYEIPAAATRQCDAATANAAAAEQSHYIAAKTLTRLNYAATTVKIISSA